MHGNEMKTSSKVVTSAMKVDHVALGRSELIIGKTREAAASFVAALNDSSMAGPVVEMVVYRMLELKDVTSALTVAACAVTKNPQDALCLASYGRSMMAADLCNLAEPALRAAQLADPAAERHARMLGVCLLRLGRFAEARASIDGAERLDENKAIVRSYLPTALLMAAVSADNCWPWAAYQLGLGLFEGRKFVEAVTHFRVATEHANRGSPLHRVACAMFADSLRRCLSKAEATVALRDLIVRHGMQSSWAALFDGLLAYADGRLEDAERFFAAVVDHPADMLPGSVGASTFVCRPRSTLKHDAAPLTLDYPMASRESDEYVIVAAADGRYVSLFAETFIASALQSAGDRHIHLHVVNATAESDAAIAHIRKTVSWLRLSCSFERVEYPKPRPYFATVRFLVARQLLDIFNRPLVIADIDAVFTKDLAHHLKEFADADVAVKKNPSTILEFPWSTVFATYSVYMPTSGARAFLHDLANYFWDRFDTTGATNSWWIDQNAMFYAENRARHDNTCRILDLANTGANGLITANLPMEPKHLFVERMRARFPLGRLGSQPARGAG